MAGPGDVMLKSAVCTQVQLEAPAFRRWAAEMKVPFKVHRKLWEFCYVAQALFERGKLRPGMRGLGFAVGMEPLPDLFANYGCEIVATDLACGHAGSGLWTTTSQHAGFVDRLNDRRICPPDQFRRLVSYRPVDMTAVPDDLTGFDFCWSACAVEHVGDLERSKQFVLDMVKCLKSGGVGVHTTEFNVFSEEATAVDGDTVVWRRVDLLQVQEDLRRRCHRMAELDLESGHLPGDCYVDEPPYKELPHLKLRLPSGFVSTSVGMIVERDGWLRRSLWERVADGVGRLRRRAA